MKALLTILFFADTILLVALTYTFLHMMDNNGYSWRVALLLMGIAGSIALLAFFLYRYIKLPPR
jgi:hypothetical protein